MRTLPILYCLPFIIVFAFIVYSSIPCFASYTGASFLNIGVGARPIGMGGAYSAVGTGVESIYWNPAGLVGKAQAIGRKSFSAMHCDWVADTNFDFVGYVSPLASGRGPASASKLLANGVLGLSVIDLSKGNLEGRDEDRNYTGTFGANDSCVTFSFARPVSVVGQKLNAGANFKIINQQIESFQTSGLALDLGIVAPLFVPSFSISLSIQNLGPQMKFISEGYDLPLSVTVGAGYILGGLTFALDIKRRVYEGRTDISFGTEYLLGKTVALRTGYLMSAISGQQAVIGQSNTMNSNPAGLGTGVGIKLRGIDFDYSVIMNSEVGNSQRASFSMEY